MSTEIKKVCRCENPLLPENLPSPASIYHGVGACRKCGGVLKFPMTEKKTLTKEQTKKLEEALSLGKARELLETETLRNDYSLPVGSLKDLILLHIAEALQKIAKDK